VRNVVERIHAKLAAESKQIARIRTIYTNITMILTKSTNSKQIVRIRSTSTNCIEIATEINRIQSHSASSMNIAAFFQINHLIEIVNIPTKSEKIQRTL
jgi:hypothetical protein